MLYTIIPYELIFEKKEDIPTNYIELKMGNKQLVLEKLSNGNYIIQRMYSTNPFDYLDVKYTPGSMISIY
ncbi:YlzJ-like protein [Thermoanaerobacter sp. YS13]|uniref:YlzJ-like family protein n=1 Tax=Thermoanaerobacter sp. YS13 TaxID=1511746 RepID=UPI000573935E|nr:YlzJ-like family protein [Thermoanaerobacter sp. YS13]KHO62491.1 YlzJ-like protein [Thermoanaerobacter sp. YS13]